jgi:hypothetical protein
MFDLVKRGSVAGLAAGFVVALVVLAYDLVQMQPLATPTVLAQHASGVPIEVTGEMGALAWLATALEAGWALALYGAGHLVVFAALGIFGAWLFRAAAVPANVLTGALFGVTGGSIMFYAGNALIAPGFADPPAWGLVALANAVAGIVIVSQLVDPELPAEA